MNDNEYQSYLESMPFIDDDQNAQPVAANNNNLTYWHDMLMKKSDNITIIPCIHNAIVMLRYHESMEGVLGFNEFSKSVDILKIAPWESESSTYPRPINDTDDTRATAWLESKHCKLSISNIHAAMVSTAHENHFHPLQDLLNGLEWDKTPRIDQALIRFFGCDDTPYIRAVSRKFFIGAVARALRPGCKLDTMMILEGAQGLKKSTAVAELFYDEWFTDELSDIGSKDAGMQMQGVWGIEVAEMATMHRAETNKLKGWLSQRNDRFRPPYARNIVEAPRQCVFIGTTNPEGGYLKDSTGARRYWPVECTAVNIPLIREKRDQLWAEAVQLFNDKNEWWLTPEEQKLAELEQDKRYECDPWDDALADFLTGKSEITVSEILNNALQLPSSQQDQRSQNRVSKYLTNLGWDKIQKRDGNKRKRFYVKN